MVTEVGRYREGIDPTSEPAAPDAHAVGAVVDRFYAAFEARDLDAMSDIWAHGDDASCTHPGWATLHGWGAIAASWFGIFDQSDPMQVFTTDVRVRVDGDTAWVTLDENLLGAGSDPAGTTVAALKVLRRIDGDWKVTAHHGSVVVGHPDE
ncbi:nuclear transport factor 2 family protein [Iamia sp. SCSIO 61187]|uniref:nuclear transport factor 2 family protein n=1 Tax=Iamia sp. SCSIO 61187 TaxID=2722752 RepID=UPI00351CF1FF